MGESEESVFWDEKEDGYGGNFISENSHSNQGFEPGIQSIYDEESGSKRIRLSPESNQQEGDADSSSQSSPLGLTLRKTPSFLSLLQRSLSKGKHAGFSTHDHDKSKTKMDDLGSQSMSEKLKASNFPAVFIKIGSWQRFTRHEGDLTAKLYYAKRKLVWEVLDGALKSKIEIQWSDIIAIRAITPDNDHGTLEIEVSSLDLDPLLCTADAVCLQQQLLCRFYSTKYMMCRAEDLNPSSPYILNQPPLFYREINPQPRKHTLWQQASDFTGGQAPIWRRHYVRFPQGILDKHYEKLLQCDKQLLALSQKPFPSHESPYFDPTMFGISELSLSFNRYGSGYLPGVQYPYHTYPTTPRGPPLGLSPNPSISVMNLPIRNEEGSNNQFLTQSPTHWSQGQGQSHSNQVFHAQNYYQPNVGLLNDIESHLLGESHVASSDHEGNLRAKVESMGSLLVATDVNANYNANHSGMSNYRFGDNSSDDQVMQSGVYSQHVNWLPPPQESNDAIAMEQAMNNSLPPFLFGNPTSGDHFF